MKKIECTVIGRVRADEARGSWAIEIDPAYREGLRAIGEFGRVHVIWWAHENDTPQGRSVLVCELPYAPGQKAGVFACRSPARPNPIAMTACGILHIDEKAGIVVLDYLDAANGTPVLDLKPYIPVSDRARNFKVPEWFRSWPEWSEDAGDFFSSASAPDIG